MTTFSDNELIDKVLKAAYDNPRVYIEVLHALEKITGIKDVQGPSEIYNITKRICRRIISEGIADCKDDREVAIMINQKGIDIIDNGGYLEYIDRQVKQALYNAKIQQATDKKLFIELTVANWKKNTFWLWFLGAIIGGLFGVISLVLELDSRGYIKIPLPLRQNQSVKNVILSDSSNKTNEPVKVQTYGDIRTKSDTLK